MDQPSDGIAEEVERQLQLALATAAIAARRAIAARQHAIEQARGASEQTARTMHAQIEAERLLATEHLRPVFDPGWWETAAPQDIAAMWQEASSWRDPSDAPAKPTIFDRAAHRIREELHDRSGLDPTQLLALAELQNLEHETAAAQQPDPPPVDVQATNPALATSVPFDDPQRRQQLRAQLAAAGVPEPAIEARALADLGQARPAVEATQLSPAITTAPRPASARGAHRERHRQR